MRGTIVNPALFNEEWREDEFDPEASILLEELEIEMKGCFIGLWDITFKPDDDGTPYDICFWGSRYHPGRDRTHHEVPVADGAIADVIRKSILRDDKAKRKISAWLALSALRIEREDAFMVGVAA